MNTLTKTFSVLRLFDKMFADFCENIYKHSLNSYNRQVRLYVWILPHNLGYKVQEDSPGEGWEILTGESIPTNLTKEQLIAKYRPMFSAAPLLPITEEQHRHAISLWGYPE